MKENTKLPADLDYREIHGLPIEAQQKLNAQKARNNWSGQPYFRYYASGNLIVAGVFKA